MRPVVACYDQGVLKPATPLALRAGEWVSVIVVRRPDPRRWDLDRLASGAAEDRALAEQGLAQWADDLDAEDRGRDAARAGSAQAIRSASRAAAP